MVAYETGVTKYFIVIEEKHTIYFDSLPILSTYIHVCKFYKKKFLNVLRVEISDSRLGAMLFFYFQLNLFGKILKYFWWSRRWLIFQKGQDNTSPLHSKEFPNNSGGKTKRLGLECSFKIELINWSNAPAVFTEFSSKENGISYTSTVFGFWFCSQVVLSKWDGKSLLFRSSKEIVLMISYTDH